jgi:ATP-binding protein involved in chromosome partitioning
VTTEAELLSAVAAVQEPELRLSLGELGLVLEVKSKRVPAVSIGLASPDHPQAAELANRVSRAVTEVTGARRPEIELVVLDESEQAELASLLRRLMGTESPAKPVAGQRLGHEEGRPNPFQARGSTTRVLGISSGKGGVGKSSVTVNLALALARSGASVAVLDADVYGFSLPRMLGAERGPMIVADLLVPPVLYGVACLSMGLFVDDDTPVIWRGPMLHKALEQFLSDTWWGRPDYLLMDMPPGTGDVALSMSQYLPRAEVYVVTTPQAAAQRVAQRSAMAALKLGLVVRGVIENMSWFTGDDQRRYQLFGEGGGQGLAEKLAVPLLGQIPLVPALREGGDSGEPVMASDPDGEAGMAFQHLAKAVVELAPRRIYRSELRVQA